jgi:oxygen-dependent protoporphyrinogen oxidase
MISGKQQVVIVGGGLTGLTAAWDLSRAGYRVIVLDGGESPGGRCRETTIDGLRVRTGARLFYSFCKTLMAVISELGINSRIMRLGHSAITCNDGRREYPLSFTPSFSLASSNAVPWSEKLRLLRLTSDLLYSRRFGDPDDLASLLAYDELNLREYLSRKGLPKFAEAIAQPIFRGARNWNIDEVSPVFFLLTTAFMLGHFGFTLRGGIGFLAETLASRIPVERGARVLQIDGGSDKCVHVTAVDAAGRCSVLEAALVVCAVTGASARSLIARPQQEVVAFFEKVRYNPLAVAYAVMDEIEESSTTFLGPRHPSGLAIVEAVPGRAHHCDSPPSYFCEFGPELSRLAVGEPRPLESYVAPHLAGLVSGRVVRWVEQRIPAMLPIPYPGYARIMAEFRNWQASEPRRIYFAGDYLSAPLVGGACASGRQVARLICRHWGL